MSGSGRFPLWLLLCSVICVSLPLGQSSLAAPTADLKTKNITQDNGPESDVPDANVKEVVISRPGSHVLITRVETLPRRHKRTIYIGDDVVWPFEIPFVYDRTAGLDEQDIKRAMNLIEDKLCVNFNDETYRYDPHDPYWFTKHGYEKDVYIKLEAGDGCNAPIGIGDKEPNFRSVKPCHGWALNLHELLHAMGAGHTQNNERSKEYMTVNPDNILPEYLQWYTKTDPEPNKVTSFFDPTSVMMYLDNSFTINGLETTFPLRDDFFDLVGPNSGDHVVFMELAKSYKCNERFCNNNQTDCGRGYFTIMKGVCRCVCPEELDPDTNCQTHINGANKYVDWPQAPMTLLTGTHCPTGFHAGKIKLRGLGGHIQGEASDPFPVDDPYLTLRTCSKTTPLDHADIHWLSWPVGGHYCFIKPEGLPCQGVFTESSFILDGAAQIMGDVGDVHMTGNDVTIKFCCTKKDRADRIIELPDAAPFKLLSASTCPSVKGMRGTHDNDGLVIYFSDQRPVVHGDGPLNFVFDQEIHFFQCAYLPPVYDCSKIIKLDTNTRAETVKTPGFGQGRDPNRRCFYSFEVPKNARVRITFHDVDMHEKDLVYVKRFHEWQAPHQLTPEDWQKQLISAGEYLSFEYWSWWQPASNQGLHFTADVILEADVCYDVSTRGDDYTGDKSVAETYEPCLPWEDAVSCLDFPFEGPEGLRLLNSGNKCRNPKGEMAQPWCYVYVNGTECKRRYCDVCNEREPFDVLKNCYELIMADPTFCISGEGRYGCSLTCDFPIHFYRPAGTTCEPPHIPLDGSALDPLKSEYRLGEKVRLKCDLFNSDDSMILSLECGLEGFPDLHSACSACPPNYKAYGDRCYFVSTEAVNRTEAENRCRAVHETGTLFEIRHALDEQMVMELQSEEELWVSGENRDDCSWKYTDSITTVTYSNWVNQYQGKCGNQDSNCEFWESLGECTNNPDFMNKNCQRSCGSCCTGTCSDSTPYCESWAASGECNRNPTYMYSNCHKSCGVPECAKNQCLVVLGTKSVEAGPVGGWDHRLCDHEFYSARYICQTQKLVVDCKDSSSHCESALDVFPNFCNDPRSAAGADIYCHRSCGRCVHYVHCTAPSSPLYTLTSGSSTAQPGDIMTFACADQFPHHIGGDLTRPCSSAGRLLGEAPICHSFPISTDVMKVRVRKRKFTMYANTAILMDTVDYRVPFDGKITRWYYYCERPGRIYFFVTRGGRGNLQMAGYNEVDCIAGWTMSYEVPEVDQLTVQSGDVVGVFVTEPYLLSISWCDQADHKIMLLPHSITANIVSLNRTMTFKYDQPDCMVPSIAYRVEP